MKAISRYQAVFGRPPTVYRGPTDGRGIAACMFPATRHGFWKSLFSEACDQTVYITAGMSAHLMGDGVASPGPYAQRVELVAVCEGPISGGPGGREDVPTMILQVIASYVLDNRLLVGVGHTLDFQEPLAPNTVMTGVLFALPERMDTKRIRRCTEARELLNVVPITSAELEFARRHGVGALIERFDAAGVPPVVVARAKAVLAKLEAGRQATGGLAAGLDDLPLFAAALAKEPEPVDALREALAGIDVDNLSPRDALDALYRLKGLLGE